MKYFTLICVCFLSLFLLSCSPALAEEDWLWLPSEDGTARIIRYAGPGGEAVVPAELDGYPVRTLYGFAGGESITKLILSEGIERVEEQYSLQSLETLVLPGSVHTIGESAFEYCSKLTSVDFTGGGLTRIEGWAFSDCQIESFPFPDTVEYIGPGAFYSGWKAEELILPEQLEILGRSAFKQCWDIRTVRCGNRLRELGDYAFSQCSKIEYLYLSGSLISIGKSCFERCEALKSIQLPEGLQTLGEEAFANCTSLKEINLPRSLACMDGNPFSGCVRLETVQIAEDHPAMLFKDGCLVSADGKRLISVFHSGYNPFHTPQGVTEICRYAFARAKINSVVLGPEVTQIDERAFIYAESIQHVTAQGHLTRIGNSAFQDTDRLDLFLMDGVDVIETAAFYDSVEEGTFYCKGDIGLIQTQGMNDAYWGLFQVDGCILKAEPRAFENMKALIYSVSGGILEGEKPCLPVQEGNTLRLPDSADAWAWAHSFDPAIDEDKVEIIELPASIREIGNHPLSSFYHLKEVRVEEGSPFVFRDGALIRKADGLLVGVAEGVITETYDVPDDVKIIGDGALSWSGTAVLHENVSDMLYNPFYQSVPCILDESCALKQVDDMLLSADGKRLIAYLGEREEHLDVLKVPDGVEIIGKEALIYLNADIVLLPDSLRVIEEKAFDHAKVRSLVLPSGLQSVEEEAFSYCFYLKSITLPEDIAHFDESAIRGCASLRYFALPACVTGLTRVDALDTDGPNNMLFLPDSIQLVAENTASFPQRSYFNFEYGRPDFAVNDGSFIQQYLASRNERYVICADSLRHDPSPEEYLLDAGREWIYRVRQDGTAEMMGYCGMADVVIVPAGVDGHPVVCFNFQNIFVPVGGDFQVIVLPDTITEMKGNFLFRPYSSYHDKPFVVQKDSYAERWAQIMEHTYSYDLEEARR